MQELISRSEAKAQGLTRYFTGRPCVHGHIAERVVASKTCVTCALDRLRKYQDDNRETIRARNNRWYHDNPEKRRKGATTWQKNNPGRVNAATAKRRAARLSATPAWLTAEQLAQIRWFYDNCPKGWEVDHIVPLQGENVCGLHVPWNLQHLPARVNKSKGNRV